MLHQIGDKKLENIAVVKLCASEMYDIYLENKTILLTNNNKEKKGKEIINEQGSATNHLNVLYKFH